MASPYVIAGIAFLVGIAVGWVIATNRAKVGFRVSVEPPGSEPASPTWLTTKTTVKKVRTMEMKCACGSVLKFRDPVEPGYQPYPAGDSVTCPNCGREKDLSEIYKLQKDAQA